MKILEEKEDKLLNRKRLTILVEHTQKPTPKKEDLKHQVAELLKIDKDLIVLKHIYSDYGSGRSKIIVNVYKDKESIGIETKKKKKKAKEEKKEAPKKEVKKE